jgi:hypothetical protein
MKTVSRSSKIDSVWVGESQISEAGNLSTKYGLADSESGHTYGSGNWNRWSKKTLDILIQLLDSMEEDIASRIFVVPTNESVQTPPSIPDDGVPGL